MATRKSTAAIENTNRQWAWQFLRRNRTYRESYAFLNSLSEYQLDGFFKLIQDQFGSYSENWEQLGSLPVMLFDRTHLSHSYDRNKTLNDYVNDIIKPFLKIKKRTKEIDKFIDDLILRVTSEFRTSHYGLSQWVDPDIDEMTAEEADEIWFYTVPVEASLLRTPWFDDAGFSFEESKWKGISFAALASRPDEIEIETVNEGTKKNQPVQAEVVPLKKGINGAIFMMNNFTTCSSHHSLDGTRIPVGRDPEPLSLDGDTLVRATFDLSMPIDYQLEAVKKYLVSHQKDLKEAGFIDALPSRKSRQGVFASYIAILDLHEQGVSDLDIAVAMKNLETDNYIDAQGKILKNYIDPNKPDWVTPQEHTSAIRKQLERARQLRDKGYRSLALQLD